MQNILVVIAVFILLGANLAITADAQDIDRTPSPAAVYDLDGNLIDKITIGHQVILSKTFVNNRNATQTFVALFEVRDPNGFTVYLAWQSGAMAASGQANVGVTWIAEGIGIYEIRTFAISNFTNATIIDVVESRSIPVIQNTGA